MDHVDMFGKQSVLHFVRVKRGRSGETFFVGNDNHFSFGNFLPGLVVVLLVDIDTPAGLLGHASRTFIQLRGF